MCIRDRDIEDWEDLPESRFKGGAEYFALKVKGDSMFPKYEDGDVLILSLIHI